ITLFDSVLNASKLYDPISSLYLGEKDIGSLRGGQAEEIVRVTLIFNFLLFIFSLVFGVWMRRTREKWTYSQMGFVLRTEKHSTKDLFEKGIIIGLFAVVLQYTIMTITLWIYSGSFEAGVLNIQAYTHDGNLFTPKQLYAEYYFGIIEMGFIWPVSAGFFFFAYCNNSLVSKFPRGLGNLLSSLFYVYYLIFFFMITQPGKLNILFSKELWNPIVVVQVIVFLIFLFISFSAFSQTKSVIIPFTITFIFNVVQTIFRSFNSTFFDGYTPLMLLPYFGTILTLSFWYIKRKQAFSTIASGFKELKEIDIPFIRAFVYSFIFILLSFIIPGILELLLFDITKYQVIIPFVSALIFIIIISTAIIVLTYEPNEVYDTLLVAHDGRPVASHLELFQSDEVLISGFFTAISSVSKELTKDESDIKSIKRGEREILIIDGVFTKIIALVDYDRPSLRNVMTKMHSDFEIKNREKLSNWNGSKMDLSDKYVFNLGQLAITFNIPQQTKWIGTLTLLFSPIMIILLGLIT
ncbi:MAG: hypothetical protein OEZ01_07670, partial [Candidatus Heimdallarchaeota archaeon]|nr:hypothetical protein [Candidatus Heimdallarchaeota archaeon]